MDVSNKLQPICTTASSRHSAIHKSGFTSGQLSSKVNIGGGINEVDKSKNEINKLNLREISNKYNLANMSLKEKESLGKGLLSSGAISPLEMAALTVADFDFKNHGQPVLEGYDLKQRFDYLSKSGDIYNNEQGREVVSRLHGIISQVVELKNTPNIDIVA